MRSSAASRSPARSCSLTIEGYCINILDTPGHQDFSEDTYRTLMAADSAVMVIDAAKGVEAQTRKLFKVCVMRDIPIFTFINKMDREARNPFDLLDEIEKELGIGTVPGQLANRLRQGLQGGLRPPPEGDPRLHRLRHRQRPEGREGRGAGFAGRHSSREVLGESLYEKLCGRRRAA